MAARVGVEAVAEAVFVLKEEQVEFL